MLMQILNPPAYTWKDTFFIATVIKAKKLQNGLSRVNSTFWVPEFATTNERLASTIKLTFPIANCPAAWQDNLCINWMKQACCVFLPFSLVTQAVWSFPKGKPALIRFTPDKLSKQCRAKVPRSEYKWIMPP